MSRRIINSGDNRWNNLDKDSRNSQNGSQETISDNGSNGYSTNDFSESDLNIPFGVHMVIGFMIRVLLVVYGHIHDHFFDVKYTDVDYRVFTDGAKYLSEGRSPFFRDGFRYTPILAYMMLPNIYLVETFGKLIFLSFDVMNGYFIYKMCRSFDGVTKGSAVFASCFWLYNPLPLVVSTRGSSDSLITALVLCSFYLLFQDKISSCGLCLGLVVHLKLYPVIYLPIIYIYLKNDWTNQSNNRWLTHDLWNPINGKRIVFVSCFMLSFIVTTGLSYMKFGQKYLDEAWIYHFKRKDLQHNFSIYFYLYHVIPEDKHDLISKIAFVPQVSFMIIYYRYLIRLRDVRQLNPMVIFVSFCQTYIFVVLNKVITSQYFLWYLSLAPILLPYLLVNMSGRKLIKYFIIWLSSQIIWLIPAYLFEYQHVREAFFWTWISSIQFLLVNIYLLSRIEIFFIGTMRIRTKTNTS